MDDHRLTGFRKCETNCCNAKPNTWRIRTSCVDCVCALEALPQFVIAMAIELRAFECQCADGNLSTRSAGKVGLETSYATLAGIEVPHGNEKMKEAGKDGQLE